MNTESHAVCDSFEKHESKGDVKLSIFARQVEAHVYSKSVDSEKRTGINNVNDFQDMLYSPQRYKLNTVEQTWQGCLELACSRNHCVVSRKQTRVAGVSICECFDLTSSLRGTGSNTTCDVTELKTRHGFSTILL